MATRKERQLKQLLFMALDQLHTTKNTAEIRYWFTEWDPSAYGMVQHMEFEDIWGIAFHYEWLDSTKEDYASVIS